MQTIIAEHACEDKPHPIANLQRLLVELSDVEQATVWEGVALALGERQHRSEAA